MARGRIPLSDANSRRTHRQVVIPPWRRQTDDMSAVNVTAVRTMPRTAEAIGLAVGPTGTVPRQLGLNRAALEAHGFTGKVGSTLVLPNGGGATLVAIGVGDKPTAATLRDA